MVEARVTRGPLPRAWTLATVAAVGLASVGCTMCPDPFDYSGPVPNGSSPQNDFRARSNGILPLGAAPRPWPLIVKDESDPAAPQHDEQAPTLADEPGEETLQQTEAVMGESEVDSVMIEPQEALRAEDVPQPALEPVPSGVEPSEAAVEQAPARKEPQALPQPPVAPVLPSAPTGETPGWRTRRR